MGKKPGGRGKRTPGFARPNPPPPRARSPREAAAQATATGPPATGAPTTASPTAARAASVAQRLANERARARASVAGQWDAVRNRPLRFDDAPVSTAVWWRCAAGHQWQEPISQRVSAAPKWKKGDPATCRACVGPLPSDMVEHTYPCGHTARIRQATADLGRPRCCSCEQPHREAERRERKRTAARESYQRVRAHGRASDEERTAQRRLVGLLNCTRVIADDHGIFVARDDALAAVLGGIDAVELAELLTLLQVPHAVHDIDDGPAIGTSQVRITWADLDALERWAPTTVRRARKVRAAHHLGGGPAQD